MPKQIQQYKNPVERNKEERSKMERALRSSITTSLLREYNLIREQHGSNPLIVLNDIMLDENEQGTVRVSAAKGLASLVMNRAPAETFVEATLIKQPWEYSKEEMEEKKDRLADLLVKANFLG